MCGRVCPDAEGEVKTVIRMSIRVRRDSGTAGSGGSSSRLPVTSLSHSNEMPPACQAFTRTIKTSPLRTPFHVLSVTPSISPAVMFFGGNPLKMLMLGGTE